MPKDIASARLTRLNELMQVLIKNGGCSKSYIANVLGYKSTRTLERDIATLRENYDVEVIYIPAEKKYKCLDTGQFLLKFRATQADVVALVAGLGMTAHFLPHLKDNSNVLWNNIKRIIPADLLEHGQELSRSVVVSIPVSPFNPAILQQMIDCISSKCVIDVKYKSPHKNSSEWRHNVSAWGIYFQSHAWYVWVGHETYPELGASYRLSRISEIVPRPDVKYAPPPKDSDIELFAGSSWFALPGELVHDIKLHIFPPLSHIVKETKWHRTQKIDTLRDGSIVYTAKVPDIEEVARWAMSCAPHIEALEPEALRKRLVELGKDIFEKHGEKA